MFEIKINFFIFLSILSFMLFLGIFIDNRIQHSRIRDIRAEFEQESRDQRNRNRELEEIIENDGIIYGELRADNQRLESENSTLRRELYNSWDYVGGLDSALESDRDSISGIFDIIERSRDAIEAEKDRYNNDDNNYSR